MLGHASELGDNSWRADFEGVEFGENSFVEDVSDGRGEDDVFRFEIVDLLGCVTVDGGCCEVAPAETEDVEEGLGGGVEGPEAAEVRPSARGFVI